MCQPGKFQDQAEQATCTECAAGTYSEIGYSECIPCLGIDDNVTECNPVNGDPTKCPGSSTLGDDVDCSTGTNETNCETLLNLNADYVCKWGNGVCKPDCSVGNIRQACVARWGRCDDKCTKTYSIDTDAKTPMMGDIPLIEETSCPYTHNQKQVCGSGDEGNCSSNFTCGDWFYLDGRDHGTICSAYSSENYDLDHKSNIDKNVLDESDKLKDEDKKQVGDICCRDTRICDDFTCPEYATRRTTEKKRQLEGGNTAIQNCCEEKSCSRWEDDGNKCVNGEFLPNGLGYSEKECCFELCGNWNKRTIKQKLLDRFKNITDTVIESVFDDDVSKWTTDDYINKLMEIDNVTDTGTPVEISNCGVDQKILTNLRGIDSDTCCISSYETCSSKNWECPENKFTNLSKLSERCDLTDGDNSRCPETEENISKCCSDYQTCGDFTCPIGYMANDQKKDEVCKGPICSVDDDLDCCSKKGQCSELNCGIGYQNNRIHDYTYCKGELCTIENDKETCCIENQTCSDMTCPIGYYQRSKNKDTRCWDGVCDQDNKLDMLLCCGKCSPVPNAYTYSCDRKGASTVIECDSAYSLIEGNCVSGKELIDISLTLDGDYGIFIDDRDHMEKAKEALCRKMSEMFVFDDCVKRINITGFKKGSVIIGFQIENDNKLIGVTQVEQLFSKDVVLDGLNMKIKETPRIRKIASVSIKPKCKSDTDIHRCPYGTRLKENSEDVYGSSDNECCVLDWEILKVILPVFLLGLLFIFIVYKRTLGRFIKIKDV